MVGGQKEKRMSPTTSGNITRVAGYTGFSGALALLGQVYLGMRPEVATAAVVVATIVAAAVWNFAKDQGWIRDNR